MTDRLRDMLHAPGGKGIGGTNHVGVLAEDVPASGADFASLLRNDVSLPADAGKRVRLEVLSHNIPAQASFWIEEDGRGYLLNCPAGVWGGTYRYWEDGVPSVADNYGLGAGVAPFTFTIGNPCILGGDAPFLVTFGSQGLVVGWAEPSCEITGDAGWLVRFNASGTLTGLVASTPAFELPVRRVAYAGRLTPSKLVALDVAETDDVAFDFGPVLRAGETVDAGTITLEAEVRYGSGTDAQAAQLFVHDPGVLMGGLVLQRVQGRVAGLTYLLRCRARSAPTGRQLVCTAFLPIRRLA